MEAIAAPIDFLGVNYYCREIVRSPLLPPLEPPTGTRPSAPAMGWEVYPEGLTEVLEFVASRTGDLPLYVTESGAAYPVDELDPTQDPERVSFLRRHLEAARRRWITACRSVATSCGRLLDNFEWAHGYAYRFGIIHVDFDTLERRVRDSGMFWAAVARNGVHPRRRLRLRRRRSPGRSPDRRSAGASTSTTRSIG